MLPDPHTIALEPDFPPPADPRRMPSAPQTSFEARLRRELRGEVLFDAFSRGRYSTDASIYQIEPLGVVVPRTADDAVTALTLAAEAGVPVLPRGAGTSQCGQTVGAALVVDNSKYVNRLLELDMAAGTAWVEPGIVLDDLNAQLKKHGVWYPVDVSTSAQATIGGMTANNSCGARSMRYGNMVHNVLAAETWLTSGDTLTFGEVAAGEPTGPERYRALVRTVRALYARERDEIEARVPKVQRRVAGYNLDMASTGAFNMAHMLVGSEGTLGYFRKLKLKLAPLPTHKALGVVHFPTFYQAMDLTQHIVKLAPAAVELVDRTMIGLSRDIAAFRATMDRTIRGEPDAILLVEFAGDELEPQLKKLRALTELMGDLGLPDSVVEIADPAWQRDVWEVRKAGLNIMMSMKGDGKPVSFIEDCAVPLEHLAEYTSRLTQVFEKHGTRGTFYAHASVGCLHVRPVLNMRNEQRRCADASDRRGSLRAREAIQRLVLRRARRRPRAQRVDRAAVWCTAHARVRRDQARVRSERPHEPRQDRRRAEDGRSLAVPFQAGLHHVAHRDGARLVRARSRRRESRPRFRCRRRDVQQQRPLPQVRRRHDVPVVPRDARRAPRHARARQLVATRALRASSAPTP